MIILYFKWLLLSSYLSVKKAFFFNLSGKSKLFQTKLLPVLPSTDVLYLWAKMKRKRKYLRGYCKLTFLVFVSMDMLTKNVFNISCVIYVHCISSSFTANYTSTSAVKSDTTFSLCISLLTISKQQLKK